MCPEPSFSSHRWTRYTACMTDSSKRHGTSLAAAPGWSGLSGVRLLAGLVLLLAVVGGVRAQDDDLPSQPVPQPAAPAAGTPAAGTPNGTPATATPNGTPAATTPPAEATPDQGSADALNSILTKIDAASELDEPAKERARAIVRKGLDDLRIVGELTQQEQTIAEKLKTVDTRKAEIEKLQRQERRLSHPWEGEKLETLERELAERQQQLAQKQAQLLQLDNQIEGRDDRKKRLRQIVADAPKKLADVATRQQALSTSTEPLIVQDAIRQSLLAERRRIERELTAAGSELAAYDAEDAVNLLSAERAIAANELSVLKQEVEEWTAAVAKRRREDAQGRKKLADDYVRMLDGKSEPLGDVYKAVASLADKEIEIREKRSELQSKLEAAKAERQRLEENEKKFHERKERAAGSTVFGVQLRQQRRTLPNVSSLQYDLAERATMLEQVQLDYLDLLEEQRQAGDLESQVARTATEMGLDTDDADVGVESQVRDAWKLERASLDSTLKAYTDLLDTIDQFNTQQQLLIELSERLTKFIDENVLWIRSHAPLNWSTLTSDTKSISNLLVLDRWRFLEQRFRQDVIREPWWYVLFAAVWAGLIASHAYQRRILRQLGTKAASRLNTEMRPTWRALLWTVMLAITLPLLPLFLGWRLEGMAVLTSFTSQNWIGQLAEWFVLIGTTLLGLEVVRNVGRPLGLGESHFGWPHRVVQLMTRQIRGFEVLCLPIVIGVALLHTMGDDGTQAVLERIFAIAGFILLTLLLHRLARPKGGIGWEWIEKNPQGWLDQLSMVWYLLAIAVPLSLAGLSALGYHYTAGRLSLKLGQTLCLLYSMLFVRALIVRGMMLRQRRLAIEQARERRAAAAEVREGDALPPVPPSGASDLVAMSEQTKRLLNTTFAIIAILGGWAIWKDVLPALNVFDRWTFPGTSITYASLGGAALLGILTTTVARNLPGFLEMLLLERLPLDRSVRYAIAAVVRYAIILVGILVGSDILGIEWENIQWLAAALTFGLGFGLQEIFANFVSGLIILFEQPVRVGDVVTIDGVSGVVNRIRIRSTTITDWDRKEYIVPNKEFITGRLLNWTLTDTVNRLTIAVGVAYGSNPNRVREILADVVRNQLHVLKDPSPVITFDGFGDSSLNFTVRAYLPSLEFRLPTTDSLHTDIYNALDEAGIEIPFPQRDIHIRSMPEKSNGLAPLESAKPDRPELNDPAIG